MAKEGQEEAPGEGCRRAFPGGLGKWMLARGSYQAPASHTQCRSSRLSKLKAPESGLYLPAVQAWASL